MGQAKPTVFIVDDDERNRRYFEAVVQQAGYATRQFALAREFLEHYEHSQPGCLLLDICMPQMSGLELQEELNRRGATIPVVFVTGIDDVPVVVEAMRHGAFDYLTKPVSVKDLLERLHLALEFDATTRTRLLEHHQAQERFGTLTPREAELLSLIVSGLSNKEAAARMDLSVRTVEIHRASVMRKMDARNTAHLVRIAMELRQAT